MKTLTWQKPGQQNVAQELIKIIINYVAELRYAKSQRLRATTSLTKYVNQQGHVTTSFLDIFETYISNNVVNAFRQEGYDNYPFKEYSDITNIFPNIKLTTKNCDE